MHVPGAPLLLEEALNNLIDNALRYTPRGGSVTVRTGLTPDERPFIEVEDTGPGIPEVERPLVMERFYRILGRGGDGSGLGLAIVREIMDQHNAQVLIEDARDGSSGQGTRFRLVFRNVL
jgi:two-component system sensor histidine kinase TctE